MIRQLPVSALRPYTTLFRAQQLHDIGDSDGGQRIDIRSGGKQCNGDGDEHCGDTDGECGSGGADDHDAAGESDGDGGTDGDVCSGGWGDRTAWLPVAEERGEHRGSHVQQLHDIGDSDGGQRIDVRCGGKQHSGDGDEHCGDADGECGPGGADDHDAAGESDGDGGTDGDVHGGGGRGGAA